MPRIGVSFPRKTAPTNPRIRLGIAGNLPARRRNRLPLLAHLRGCARLTLRVGRWTEMPDREQSRQAGRNGVSCPPPPSPASAAATRVADCVSERSGPRCRRINPPLDHVGPAAEKRLRNRSSRNGSQCPCRDGPASLRDISIPRQRRPAICQVSLVQSRDRSTSVSSSSTQWGRTVRRARVGEQPRNRRRL
jgi:hypothetical protein